MAKGLSNSRAILALLLPVSLLLVSGFAFAAPTARCQAERLGERVRSTVTLHAGLSAQLEQLLRLGMTGTVHIHSGLYRRRRFWFDDQLGSNETRAVLIFDRRVGRFKLDDRDVSFLSLLNLPSVVVRPEKPGTLPGAQHVEILVRIEIVTAASLGQMTRWLGGRPTATGEAGSSGILGTFLRGLADELVSEARAECPVP